MAGQDRSDKEQWLKRVLGVAMPEVRKGTVNYAKMLLEWRQAQQRAAANLSDFGSAVLALEEVQDDPRFARVAAAVKTLPDLIPRFGEELGDHLDNAMTEGETDAGRKHLRDAIGTIGTYRQLLAGVPALEELANLAKRSVGFELVARAELGAALARIQQDIGARALNPPRQNGG